MNNEKIKTYIRILYQVRIQIKDKENEFICIAIEKVKRDDSKLRIEYRELIKAIQEKLDGEHVLDEWVRKKYKLKILIRLEF